MLQSFDIVDVCFVQNTLK